MVPEPPVSRFIFTLYNDFYGGLPEAYTRELYHQKCSTLFEHVYESYPQRDAGVYAMGA